MKEKGSSDGAGELSLCIFVRASKVDATAALSTLDDTISTPHISRRSQ